MQFFKHAGNALDMIFFCCCSKWAHKNFGDKLNKMVYFWKYPETSYGKFPFCMELT